VVIRIASQKFLKKTAPIASPRKRIQYGNKKPRIKITQTLTMRIFNIK